MSRLIIPICILSMISTLCASDELWKRLDAFGLANARRSEVLKETQGLFDRFAKHVELRGRAVCGFMARTESDFVQLAGTEETIQKVALLIRRSIEDADTECEQRLKSIYEFFAQREDARFPVPLVCGDAAKSTLQRVRHARILAAVLHGFSKSPIDLSSLNVLLNDAYLEGFSSRPRPEFSLDRISEDARYLKLVATDFVLPRTHFLSDNPLAFFQKMFNAICLFDRVLSSSLENARAFPSLEKNIKGRCERFSGDCKKMHKYLSDARSVFTPLKEEASKAEKGKALHRLIDSGWMPILSVDIAFYIAGLQKTLWEAAQRMPHEQRKACVELLIAIDDLGLSMSAYLNVMLSRRMNTFVEEGETKRSQNIRPRISDEELGSPTQPETIEWLRYLTVLPGLLERDVKKLEELTTQVFRLLESSAQGVDHGE